jgi:uncharacterized membrane protein
MQISPILALHICAGIIGLLSGAVAMSFRKGSRRHGIAGKVFVIAMLSLGASAMYLAVMKHEVGNFVGGILTIYLVTTGWLTARRRDGETSIFDWAALLIPLGVGVSTLTLGIQKLNNPAAFHDGVPVGMNFFMGTVVLLAAAGRAHDRARYFWHTTYCAASLAHVLWAVFPLRVHLHSTATFIPRLVKHNPHPFAAGCPATDNVGFLDAPSSLPKRVPENCLAISSS